MHVDIWLREAETHGAQFVALSQNNQVVRIKLGNDKATLYLGDAKDPVAFLEQIINAAREGIKHFEGKTWT